MENTKQTPQEKSTLSNILEQMGYTGILCFDIADISDFRFYRKCDECI